VRAVWEQDGVDFLACLMVEETLAASIATVKENFGDTNGCALAAELDGLANAVDASAAAHGTLLERFHISRSELARRARIIRFHDIFVHNFDFVCAS